MKKFLACLLALSSFLAALPSWAQTSSSDSQSQNEIVCGITKDKKPILCTKAQFETILQVLRQAQAEGKLHHESLSNYVRDAGATLLVGGFSVAGATLLLESSTYKYSGLLGKVIDATADRIGLNSISLFGYGTLAGLTGGAILVAQALLTPSEARTGDFCDQSNDLNAVDFMLSHQSDDRKVIQDVNLCPDYGVTMANAAHTLVRAKNRQQELAMANDSTRKSLVPNLTVADEHPAGATAAAGLQ